MARFQTCLFRLHPAAGVSAGAVVLIMSVTGVALTYEKQMLEWADRRASLAPSSTVAERLSPETLLASVRGAQPEAAPATLILRADGPQEDRIDEAMLNLNGAVVMGLVGQAQTTPRRQGVLLLAHGGNAEWNGRVAAVGAEVDKQQPTEMAFGMASRATMQAAVERLEARGVTGIVAVPLFVSSWSSVIRSTEYLLSLRKDAPADLALFARLDHSGHAGAGAHAGHAMAAVDGTLRVTTRLPIRITAALNRHPLIGQILADRAAEISRSPASEAAVIVAHGPVPEEDNHLWLGDMASLAAQVRASRPFAAVHYLTVRDDAPAEMKAAATAEFRDVVQKEITAGRRVLIVPHLMSFGGVEQGVKKRLHGLDYTIASQALMPDARITQWVIGSVSSGTQALR